MKMNTQNISARITGTITFFLLSFMISHTSIATCWVRTATIASNNFEGLVGLVSAINRNDAQTNACSFDDGSFNGHPYSMAIKFVVNNYCETPDNRQYCEDAGMEGIAEDQQGSLRGFSVIHLEHAITLDANVHYLVGNENAYDHYGLPLLDTRSFTEMAGDRVRENVFDCQNNHKVGLRNIIINTVPGLTKGRLLAAASCLRDEGDVFVCDGEIQGDPQSDPNWCHLVIPTDPDEDDDDFCVDANGDDLCGSGDHVGDCNDHDDSIHPGASEVCNGEDDDCDNLVDEGNLSQPARNQVGRCAGTRLTCQNGDFELAPGSYQPQAEECNNLDDDCDGQVDEGGICDDDDDGDGVVDDGPDDGDDCGGQDGRRCDCDDGNPDRFPGNQEICGDGVDQDCDGQDLECGPDIDRDGDQTYIDGEDPDDNCGPVAGAACDCDDNNPNRHPGNFEIPGDGIDQDCDGTDGGCSVIVAPGVPANGHVNAGEGFEYLVAYVVRGGYHPNATLRVVGLHETMTLEAAAPLIPWQVQHLDFGTAAQTPNGDYPLRFIAQTFYNMPQNSIVQEASANQGDGVIDLPLLDGVSLIDAARFNFSQNMNNNRNMSMDMSNMNPGIRMNNMHVERLVISSGIGNLVANGSLVGRLANGKQTISDGIGNLTSGLRGFTCETTVTVTVAGSQPAEPDDDDDGDGVVDDGPDEGDDCGVPGGLCDCDDNDPARFPGNAEICGDAIDQDCDGLDCNDNDSDGDGIPDSEDCAPQDPAISPNVEETCGDGVDQNCDGIDSLCGEDTDDDSDGFVDDDNHDGKCGSDPAIPCDCNDADASIHPGAPDVCGNGIDEDCSGVDEVCVDLCTDTGLPPQIWFRDIDSDFFGNPTDVDVACSQPDGFVPDANDCDDNNSAVNPNIKEVCDNLIDDNCDGLTDGDDSLTCPAPGIFDFFSGQNLVGGGCSLNSTAAPSNMIWILLLMPVGVVLRKRRHPEA